MTQYKVLVTDEAMNDMESIYGYLGDIVRLSDRGKNHDRFHHSMIVAKITMKNE